MNQGNNNKRLQFKVSSALKDILGKDLITNDFVAVFELVKNAYDAHATRVDLIFQHLYSDHASITIKDNGKGMTYDDLTNKWLFVAYSAKREGTEDNNYINKINLKRAYAGAKGIGRFSCDRLGKNLMLSTKVAGEDANHVVTVNWEDFEASLKEEFGEVDVIYSVYPEVPQDAHGTSLQITNLREQWNRDKLLQLKNSLAKLINPNKGLQENAFDIFISANDEIEEDEKVDEQYNLVNGPVHNFIFEELELKTTQILVSISNDGKQMISELMDGGTLIYKLTEVNPFKQLRKISFTLFYLNQSAKIIFAKRMGVSTTGYGNIFLYKNGFRIYPFGEPGEDPLKVNARYAQGYNRYLGLRNLIGRIEIGDNNPDLKETSSRADGLIKSRAYIELEEAFWVVLKRLEKYIIDVQKWGLGIEDNLEDASEHSRNAALLDLINKLSDAKEIIDVEYGDNLIRLLETAQADSALNFVKKLKGIAEVTSNPELQKIANSAEKRIFQMHSALDEAEKEKQVTTEKKKQVELKLEHTIKQNLLLKNATNEDTIEILSIEHHVNQATHRVDRYLQNLVKQIKNNSHIDVLIDIANSISLENRKISSLVNFVRKAKFDTMSASYSGDLINYIAEYIENIYKEDTIRIINKTLIDIDVHFNPIDVYEATFVPLEMNIILDNLLDNSFKASASKADLFIRKTTDEGLELIYKDNGTGIEKSNFENIFEFGFSTTIGGSGIGLFHVKKLLEENYNGEIKPNHNASNGAEFNIKIKLK